MFVTAPDESFAVVEETIKEQSIDDLIEEIRANLKTLGAYGIRGCARLFRNLDKNGNRQIDMKEL